MNERAGLGFALQVRLRQLLDDLFAAAAERGVLEDPLVADTLAALHVRTEQIRLLAWKGLTDVERYGQPGPRARWSSGCGRTPTRSSPRRPSTSSAPRR